MTMKVYFYGGFHHVGEIVLQIPAEAIERLKRLAAIGELTAEAWREILSDGQIKRLDKHFCGVSDCSCGGAFSQRGDVKICTKNENGDLEPLF